MNFLICPICQSEDVHNVIWNKKIYNCGRCKLMFNQILKEFDYENETKFIEDKELLKKYNQYAKRDFDLIEKELCGVNTVLEIGGGYGLLSVNIRRVYPHIKYYHLEKNISLRKLYESRGDCALQDMDQSINPDLIIMAHCLEHIKEAPLFIEKLLDTYKNADIVLFQTNPLGFIPKYLPWLWYGWSLDQHFYHFSVDSLSTLMRSKGRTLKRLKYYKLHQEVSLSIKGIVKMILSLINLFVKNNNMDAYMIRFSNINNDDIPEKKYRGF